MNRKPAPKKESDLKRKTGSHQASADEAAERSAGFWKDVDRWWFGWHTATALGVYRILAAFFLLANFFLLSFDFQTWFTERGFVPTALNDTFAGTIQPVFNIGSMTVQLPFAIPRLSLLGNVTDARVSLLFYVVIVIACVFTLIGWKTRLSSIILAIGVVSLQHRNFIILHGGDTVMRLNALYLAVAPSGAALSVDRLIALWKGKQDKEPPAVSVWPQRIVQFNLALIYFTTWWLKMDGSHWRDGSAVWYTSRLAEFFRFPYPMFIKSYPVSAVLSYVTVAIELSMGTLVFYKPVRKWVLAGGLALHAVIEYTMNIPLFAFAICSMYVTFYEGEEVSGWADRMKARIASRFPRQRRVILAPAGWTFDPVKLTAIEAAHPFADIEYRTGEGSQVAIAGADGKPSRWASLTAAPAGLLPFLWRRMCASALTPSPSGEADDRSEDNAAAIKSAAAKPAGKVQPQ